MEYGQYFNLNFRKTLILYQVVVLKCIKPIGFVVVALSCLMLLLLPLGLYKCFEQLAPQMSFT